MSSDHHQLSSSAADERRRCAGFHRSTWGDYFLAYSDSHERMDFNVEAEQKLIEELKDEVKQILVVAASDDNKPQELLNLIDHIQRLGISYHFEKEINKALHRVYKSSYYDTIDGASCKDDDLHTTALMFRLLRQQGYTIPCSVFYKFRGPDGIFNESIKTDTPGLLSLYEASHLRVHGEDILEEALAFTATHLTSIKDKLIGRLGDQISRALKHPIRKACRRVEAWHYIKFFEEEASHNELFLKLAKLDFNLLQKQHQKELGNITRWWKTLDVEKNFPFARDRITEGYLWSQMAYEPEYAPVRMIWTKVFGIIAIIDDIFDAHGTYEELEIFTTAIERWDMEVIDELPNYMKVCYKELLDVYKEFEQLLSEEVRSHRLYYGIKSMKMIVRAYFDEAKWHHEGYTPTLEEYMKVGRASSGAFLLTTSAFLGMGDVATRDAFEWLFGYPKIARACDVIYRLVNDLATHEFEQKRGHVASAVECYMMQHGVTKEEAKHELYKQVEDSWKDINEELLHPMAVPAPFLTVILNMARGMDVFYEDMDTFTDSKSRTKDIITFLFINPLSIAF